MTTSVSNGPRPLCVLSVYMCECEYESVFDMGTCVYKGILVPVRSCGDQKSREGCLVSDTGTLYLIPLLDSLTEAAARLATQKP